MNHRWQGKHVGVLMGGMSHEREVSLKTGRAILATLKQEGYDAVGIDVSFDIVQRLLSTGIEVAFIGLHGRWGEDGTVQGLLELLQVPYTGSGVLASALAMNKIKSKEMFLYHGIPTPEFTVTQSEGPLEVPFVPPWVVKPVSEGSTVGVSIVREPAELGAAVRCALRYDRQVLIERFVRGRELTVGVLKGEALPIVEIAPRGGFYDYTAKYTPGMTEYIIPAKISDRTGKKAQKFSLEAYHALGCSGCARVDLFLNESEDIFITEVNTLPGMTETSLVPKAAAHKGLSFGQLVLSILEDASLKVQEGEV